MVFYCKANTLPPNIGRLSVRANAITLRPVPIGYERGPLQVIELSNCGSAPAYWMLNQASINDLQAQNYGFPLLTIHPTSGNLDPKSRLFLHAYALKIYHPHQLSGGQVKLAEVVVFFVQCNANEVQFAIAAQVAIVRYYSCSPSHGTSQKQ